MTEPIIQFSGEHAFMSSFAQIPFTYVIPAIGLVTLPDREHGLQALKAELPHQARLVLQAGTAKGAKVLGREIRMREDWEQVKRGEMLSLILAQLCQQRGFREMLLATGDAELVEGNTWGDIEWGAVPLPHAMRYETKLPVWAGMTFHGHNWLGRALMVARHFYAG